MSTLNERIVPLEPSDVALIAPLEKQIRNSPKYINIVGGIFGTVMMSVLYFTDAPWWVALIFGLFLLLMLVLGSAAMRQFAKKFKEELQVGSKLVVTGRLMDAFELQKDSKDPRVRALQMQMMQGGTTKYYWQVGERVIPLQQELYQKAKTGDLVSVHILPLTEQTFRVESGWTEELYQGDWGGSR